MKHPRAFISHAHADKARFVTPFAAALRNPGAVAVWVDEWEMKLGDSLVEKIFGEGLQAANVIAVVSNHSISSKWVREELNYATVRRIKGKARILPVILDELGEGQIPEVVEHLLWHRVPNPPDDPANIRAAAERVAAAIHGQSHPDKPALAPMPAYALVGEESAQIYGLGKFGSYVLASICQRMMETGEYGVKRFPITPKIKEVIQQLKDSHGPEVVARAFDRLENQDMVLRSISFAGKHDPHAVTEFGVNSFIESHFSEDEIRTLCGRVAAFLFNGVGSNSNVDIFGQFKDTPLLLVDYALRDMENFGCLKIEIYSIGTIRGQIVFHTPNMGVLEQYIEERSDEP